MKIKQEYTLRQPTGTYTVGAVSFTYTYQPQGDGSKPRVIPCLCFYPAANKGEGKLKPYVHEKLMPGAGSITTNSYLNAPVADGQHPLLVFNHGFTLFNEANTIQCEELASHGYIVLCVGHIGGGSYELPNGELILVDNEQIMIDFASDAAGRGAFIPYAMWQQSDGRQASLDEQREQFQQVIEGQPGFTAHNRVWVADSLEALERFLGDGDNPLYGHVNPAQIGAFGMSYGGSAALSLTFDSARVKAAANLDGFYYSPVWQQPFTKPVLLMENSLGRTLIFPFMNAGHDAYLVTLIDSTHANFSDYSAILAENPTSKMVVNDTEIEMPMLGGIDPDRMEDLMNTLLLDFFGKYLKGEPSRILDSDAALEDAVLERR